MEAPKGRREEFVEPYFKVAGPKEVVAVLKGRELGRGGIGFRPTGN
jgi:hypothetical protein